MSGDADKTPTPEVKPTPEEAEQDPLPDLDCLSFPGDIDWTSTLVLRCDPAGVPYTLDDVVHAVHNVVRRTDVYNLGPTFLNHVYTVSFKSGDLMESFVKFLLRNSKTRDNIKVKGHRMTITRVPSKCVTVTVKNIPLEIDSAQVLQHLTKYGTVVKTELIRSSARGWFHVYNNDRRITLFLNEDVVPEDLPYGINVKGLFGAVHVNEREPKCLECYSKGHTGPTCDFKGCILYKEKA